MKQVNIKQKNEEYLLDCTIDENLRIYRPYCICVVKQIIKNKIISESLNNYDLFHYFIESFEDMLIEYNTNYSIDDFEFNFSLIITGITKNNVK